jgi:hypothetical protein
MRRRSRKTKPGIGFSLAGTLLSGRGLFTARQLPLYGAGRSLDTYELGELRPSLLELHSTVTGSLFEPSDPEEPVPLVYTVTVNVTLNLLVVGSTPTRPPLFLATGMGSYFP